MKSDRLGRLVKAVRYVEGKTQQEAAAEIGISRRSLVRYETTNGSPHPEAARRMRKWLANGEIISIASAALAEPVMTRR